MVRLWAGAGAASTSYAEELLWRLREEDSAAAASAVQHSQAVTSQTRRAVANTVLLLLLLKGCNATSQTLQAAAAANISSKRQDWAAEVVRMVKAAADCTVVERVSHAVHILVRTMVAEDKHAQIGAMLLQQWVLVRAAETARCAAAAMNAVLANLRESQGPELHVGKTACCLHLLQQLLAVTVLEKDVLTAAIDLVASTYYQAPNPLGQHAGRVMAILLSELQQPGGKHEQTVYLLCDPELPQACWLKAMLGAVECDIEGRQQGKMDIAVRAERRTSVLASMFVAAGFDVTETTRERMTGLHPDVLDGIYESAVLLAGNATNDANDAAKNQTVEPHLGMNVAWGALQQVGASFPVSHPIRMDDDSSMPSTPQTRRSAPTKQPPAVAGTKRMMIEAMDCAFEWIPSVEKVTSTSETLTGSQLDEAEHYPETGAAEGLKDILHRCNQDFRVVSTSTADAKHCVRVLVHGGRGLLHHFVNGYVKLLHSTELIDDKPCQELLSQIDLHFYLMPTKPAQLKSLSQYLAARDGYWSLMCNAHLDPLPFVPYLSHDKEPARQRTSSIAAMFHRKSSILQPRSSISHSRRASPALILSGQSRRSLLVQRQSTTKRVSVLFPHAANPEAPQHSGGIRRRLSSLLRGHAPEAEEQTREQPALSDTAPARVLQDSLQHYLLAAMEVVPVTLFRCEGWFKEGKTLNKCDIAFHESLSFGMEAAAASHHANHRTGLQFYAAIPRIDPHRNHPAAKLSAMAPMIQSYKLDASVTVTTVDMTGAVISSSLPLQPKAWSSVTLNNIPEKEQSANWVTPGCTWLEGQFAAYDPKSRKHQRTLEDLLATASCAHVQEMLVEAREPFPILVDGQVYGPFLKIRYGHSCLISNS
eukprot:jgi/Chlat1/2481/Chrsp175S02360